MVLLTPLREIILIIEKQVLEMTKTLEEQSASAAERPKDSVLLRGAWCRERFVILRDLAIVVRWPALPDSARQNQVAGKTAVRVRSVNTATGSCDAISWKRFGG